jgi:periplasmic divalent cation tolerance protein
MPARYRTGPRARDPDGPAGHPGRTLRKGHRSGFWGKVGPMTTHYQVTTTTATRDEATGLARSAVERRHAACAQVSGPIVSIYRWEGRVETSDEWRCVFKTSAAAHSDLTTFLRDAHSYAVPEIVSAVIDGGDPDYLRWIDTETGQDS